MSGHECIVEGTSLRRGAKVEMWSGRSWWNAQIWAVAATQVLVHYDGTGGSHAEDEIVHWPFRKLRLCRHIDDTTQGVGSRTRSQGVAASV